jgi:NAD+ kinase
MDRPIVLSEGATVEVVVTEDTLVDVAVTFDGDEDTAIMLHAGDRIVARSSERHSHFVRLRDRNYFYRSLLDRLEPRIRTR